MELTAAIKALEYLKDEKYLKINTDSNYLKNGINLWIFQLEKE
jgi:ribonuclease HI